MSTKVTYSGVLRRREQADAALREFESKVGATVLSVWPEFGDMKQSEQKAAIRSAMEAQQAKGNQRVPVTEQQSV